VVLLLKNYKVFDVRMRVEQLLLLLVQHFLGTWETL